MENYRFGQQNMGPQIFVYGGGGSAGRVRLVNIFCS